MEKRNFNNIEFLRIIGCIAIVWFHLTRVPILYSIEIFKRFSYLANAGYTAVDLFFIISGVFFGFGLNKSSSIIQFLKKRLIRLYPVLVAVMLTGFIISFTKLFKFNIYKAVLTLFCLNGTSFMKDSTISDWATVDQFWYVSSLLWVSAFYFYLLKNFDKKVVNLIIALIVYFSYTFLIHPISDNVYQIWYGGVLRALAGVGTGYFISELYKNYGEKISKIQLNVLSKILISVIEFMCIFFTINNLSFHKLKFDNVFIYYFVFALLITLFIFKKGYISNMLNIHIWTCFSKYTYSVYMAHCLCILTLCTILSKYPSVITSYHYVFVPVILLACILFGIILYHFIEQPFKKILK
ncbi:MAG: acyltransferase [Alphaproteobacteria bacterium]|nr:acyltransferase [Alphaproteobacteria bacterium]